MEENISGQKRKRVRQACDYCRFKRVKCDGNSPVCGGCQMAGETCLYTTSTKRRGLPTGYTHDLEKRNNLFQSLVVVLTAENPVLKTRILKLLTDAKEKKDLIQDCPKFNRIWNESNICSSFNQLLLEEGEHLHEIKINSTNQETDKETNVVSVVELPEKPLYHFQDDFVADYKNEMPVVLQYHGLSSVISGFTAQSIETYSSKLPMGTRSPFRVGSIFNVRSSSIRSSPPEIFQFPLNTRKLVDLYFKVIHPWLPMLDRISIIRYTHKTMEDKQETDVNFISVIWAILALGKSCFGGAITVGSRSLAAIYAKNSISALENSPSSTTETIQAILLLGLYYYGSGEWDHSSVLISSATRMAIDVRLMANDTSDKPTSSRERTWAAVYILNTMLSCRMGRSPLVRASDWPIPRIEEDGWEEWESWKEFTNDPDSENCLVLESGRCLSIHNCLLSIISILNLAITSDIGDATEDKSNLKFTDKPKQEISLRIFELKLENWFIRLPKYCALSDRSPSFVIFLHLAYHLVWCILSIRVNESASEERRTLLNPQYSKSPHQIEALLTQMSSPRIINLPFVDYFISISIFSCEGSSKNANHFTKLSSLLSTLSRSSIPCKITNSLFEIMKVNETMDSKNGTSEPLTSTQGYPKQSQYFGIESTTKSPISASLSNKMTSSFGSIPTLGNNNNNQNELDLFMMDTFTKDETKIDQFMKNLGFIGSFNEIGGTQTPLQDPLGSNGINNSNIGTSNDSQSGGLLEIENIGLHEYLQSLVKDNTNG